jgi:hypothetical protein
MGWLNFCHPKRARIQVLPAHHPGLGGDGIDKKLVVADADDRSVEGFD